MNRATGIVLIISLSVSNSFALIAPQSFKLKKNSISHRDPQLYLSSKDIDRFESIKSASVSAIAGSIAYIPFALLSGLPMGFSAQWEFNSDTLALILALFGITYRYTIRDDATDQLKQGAIGAFAITRAISLIHVPDTCSSLPLNCGPPFFYLDISMILSGLWHFIESYAAFAGSAIAIDNCLDEGIISPKSSSNRKE